jgi:aryl-alcohol dehydrogenase-like predicted oxidoreductase
MTELRLGRTEIITEKNGFGALPIQRVALDEAVKLLRKAYEGGIRFFDTSRVYSDSEEKIGAALSGVREHTFIATKVMSRDVEGFWKDLETSLIKLKTEYIDVYQFHMPPFCPKPGDGSGLYEAMLEAKKQGKIRFIGITNHSLKVALEAAESDLYDTVQFPFSYLSGEQDLALVQRCKEKDIGFICMKALAGGLITNSAAAYAWMTQFDNALPIWGIQRLNELEEFLTYVDKPVSLTPELQKVIDKDRDELAGDFCRGCGYCMPCPAGIEISICARMSLVLRRSRPEWFLSPVWQGKMAKIGDCLHCDECREKCPYELDTPTLLEENYRDYLQILKDPELVNKPLTKESIN